jgi:hypothetical protein
MVRFWRKLHSVELCNLFASANIITVIRRVRWAGNELRMAEMRNAYKILIGKPEGKRPRRRPICRLEDNIGIDIRDTGFHMVRSRIRWRAVVNTVMNLQIPRKAGNILTS